MDERDVTKKGGPINLSQDQHWRDLGQQDTHHPILSAQPGTDGNYLDYVKVSWPKKPTKRPKPHRKTTKRPHRKTSKRPHQKTTKRPRTQKPRKTTRFTTATPEVVTTLITTTMNSCFSQCMVQCEGNGFVSGVTLDPTYPTPTTTTTAITPATSGNVTITLSPENSTTLTTPF